MTNTKKGFTIIEVVLVLAVAGLIFLMVFIALPALQRAQRNSRRRSDIARFISAVSDYQTNNSGKVPCQSIKDGNECIKSGGQLERFILTNIIADGNASNYKITPNLAQHAGTTISNADGSCVEAFCDPDGAPYYMTAFTWNTITAKTFAWESGDENYKYASDHHEVMYALAAKCSDDEEGKIEHLAGVAQISMMYILEGGAVLCADNQ